jgi:hypothetical protein
MSELKSVGIIGTGMYVPEKVMTNFDLEKIVETSDEWIKSRTGISERRIAGENEACSDLAVKAAERALKDAGVLPEEIDLVIVATITPDFAFPATAALVQHKIGAVNNFKKSVSTTFSTTKQPFLSIHVNVPKTISFIPQIRPAIASTNTTSMIVNPLPFCCVTMKCSTFL